MAIGSKRNVKVEIQASSRPMDRALRETRKQLKAFKKDAATSLGAVGKVGRSLGSSMMGFGAAALGGMALASTASEVLNFERSFTRLQIATEASDSQMNEFRSQIMKVSRDSGLAREEILGGASAYVALTGDAAGARESIALFAKVANATGSTMDDIANTAAAMRDNLRIDPKDFEPAFSALAVQGKAGAVELRELASQLAGVAPSFAAFKGGAGVDGLREMGAALQVIRKGFGSASEASTGMRALMVSLQRHAGKFGKEGVKVFQVDPKTKKKTLRDFSDIIDDIGKSKLAQDPKLLINAFGSDEAKRAYDQLILNRGLFDQLIAKSKDANVINRDAAKHQISAAAKIEKAWNAAKLSLAEAFTPERLQTFAKAVEALAWTIDRMARTAEGSWLLLQGINTQEKYAAKVENEEKRARQAPRLEKHMRDGKSYDEAVSAVTGEDAARSMFRTGRLDKQSFGWMEAQRERLGGSTNASDLDVAIDNAINRKIVGDRQFEGMMSRAIDAMKARASHLAPTGFVVKFGSDTAAVVTSNAPVHRTRPGGL